jgi:hypothetical protein
MIRIPTEFGELQLEEEQLLSARVSVNYNPDEKELCCVIRWRDSGIVGQPRIDFENDGFTTTAVVSIRKPQVNAPMSQETRRLIQSAYIANGRNARATARQLGISPYFVTLATLWIQRPKSKTHDASIRLPLPASPRLSRPLT